MPVALKKQKHSTVLCSKNKKRSRELQLALHCHCHCLRLQTPNPNHKPKQDDSNSNSLSHLPCAVTVLRLQPEITARDQMPKLGVLMMLIILVIYNYILRSFSLCRSSMRRMSCSGLTYSNKTVHQIMPTIIPSRQAICQNIWYLRSVVHFLLLWAVLIRE